MFTFERPWDYCLMMLAVLRFSNLPYYWEAAAYLRAKLNQTPADQELVGVLFPDSLDHRSIFWASWRMGDKLLFDW